MKKALSLASVCSANSNPVLITGETGTGKELIAKAVHYNSDRKDKPLVIVNCGFKTETLLESELFGHIKGAFTGAINNKKGLFKEADEGTIFLDEIGDAPLPIQKAILRVIQEGEIRPLGSTKTEIVDVRVISATNKDLTEEIEKQRFREDLFYRLNTFTIELPPLRDRKSDILLFANHFLKKLQVDLQKDNLEISSEAIKFCENYDWPGNVRQLENEINRAAAVCGIEDIIEVNDFSPALVKTIINSDSYSNYRGRLKDLVEKIEIDVIKSTLTEYQGNFVQTAEVLGLSRKGLKTKMARYKIEKL